MFNCISENITAIGWWVGVGGGLGGRPPPEPKCVAIGLDIGRNAKVKSRGISAFEYSSEIAICAEPKKEVPLGSFLPPDGKRGRNLESAHAERREAEGRALRRRRRSRRGGAMRQTGTTEGKPPRGAKRLGKRAKPEDPSDRPIKKAARKGYRCPPEGGLAPLQGAWGTGGPQSPRKGARERRLPTAQRLKAL